MSDLTNELRPLQRLRELARDLEAGIARDDMTLVTQAAGLLGAAVAECQRACETWPVTAGEAAELALETRSILNRCEAMLMQAMSHVGAEIRRLQQGKRVFAAVRTPTATRSDRLDTCR